MNAKIDARITRLFPFALTPGQRGAIDEICRDMARPHPMNRLLQGDVGSGKTVVAMYAMLLAVAHGHQAALMAPTEILARQHLATLNKALAASKVRIGLLTGSLTPAERAELLGKIAKGEIDIVVGTQLVTKGYHFPNLTLVGVVDADLGLAGGDLRAAERSFQQIQQVAGRAGRGDKPGRVLVQTHDPEAPVIAALVSGDVAGFYAAETEARRQAAMPPFGRLAAIVISAEDASETESVARRIGHAAPRVEGMAVFGPAPAPLAMLRGRHRQRLLVHAARSLDVQDVIRDWLDTLDWGAKVRVAVDVDPYSFL